MKLKIIFMQENHFYSSAPLYSNLWQCCWDVPWPFLLLTSSEVLRTCLSMCHYLMCYGWRCVSFSYRKFCFLKDFLPFSLFFLEFWLSRERTGLIIWCSSLCSHIVFLLVFFFERDFYLSAFLWNSFKTAIFILNSFCSLFNL